MSTVLSQSRGSAQDRHRKHRRQISTPTAIETAKSANLPAPALQQFHKHRRGQSLDQRPLRARQFQSVPDQPTPSTNITAPYTTPQLQFQHLAHQIVPDYSTLMNLSLLATPEAFPQNDLQPIIIGNNNHNNTKDTHPLTTTITPNTVATDNGKFESEALQLALSRIQQQQLIESNLSYNNIQHHLNNNTTWGLTDSAAIQHQASNAPSDIRSSSVESDVNQKLQQPCTPVFRSNDSKTSPHETPIGTDLDANVLSGYHPITPASSPFRNSVDLSHCAEDVQQAQSMNNQYLTIASPTQPLYRHQAKSMKENNIGPHPYHWQSIEIPSPPDTASFDVDSFDVFDYQQASSNTENKESNNSLQNHNDKSQSPKPAPPPPTLSSQSSDVQESNQRNQKVPILPITPRQANHRKTPSKSTPSKPRLSPRAPSIGNLNLDSRVHASINETGVTIDDIASFIHGPDTEDGKWVCLHEGCGRRFGRKENIKSHVQTHLGDRQYKCDHCSKCFVRGHDLKRHAKIHTGDKPYECLCGNVFARHDALTRHRQRGMCIGGYKGIVRKTTKRGRPRKPRPEMGERLEKAQKTREMAAANGKQAAATASSSSVSGSSDFSSADSSPVQSFRKMHIRNSSTNTTDGAPPPSFQIPNYSIPPTALGFTPPASPGYNNGNNLMSDWSLRSLTPNTDEGDLPKSSLVDIPEDSELPVLDAAGTGSSGSALNSTTDVLLSSPHHAPTLTDSSTVSDFDVFISQDPTTSTLTKDGLSYFDDPDMVGFSDKYNDYTANGGGAGDFDDPTTTNDFFSSSATGEAGGSTNPNMSDDDFLSLQFHAADDQSADVFTRDLFID